ncbi:MAG: mannose-1-phosphate guanylyltransferase/mannose-6-phosphate isomerase [Gammaproteobacteria bacterium]|nr:mannose-1-phosphate guanylyltransferase/mannose-6-phosphate isomerase [Gammaproteobacteria bacterium]MCP4089390.1 mannose-1-phosphate guanylyltransferase/mannose-6-phosphate isomerase [Gammaproteobacteria bacterium]MCP4277504.1 mannose-1-phosphate guanylyltransferase/mannose-6-phosphate isomerase [Gammaproteobacteria bacterium]MCP4831113.1 mannose-1-phosphate guanylyltransferase/mannose-6-phosphate isomerase [Gammaproteobacteria bacterium]MCP4928537.1 mannose-1-phosphate guanylyltransferase/
MKLLPVILCGGSGSRLWPMSRSQYPKQLLRLIGDNSLLQGTMTRLGGLSEHLSDPLLICNEQHRFLVAQQFADIGITPKLVLEPLGRNTAPATAIAALLQEEPESTLLLILPSDHVIGDTDAMTRAIQTAIPAAEAGRLVTFGIVPTSPETGYGYIRSAGIGEGVIDVDSFVEKPDLETARAYLKSGEYFWNSGMFLFSAATFLEELAIQAPKMAAACQGLVAGLDTTATEIHLSADEFAACPADSIDYAVMENTDRASVVPLDAGWNDVGSWASLHDVSVQDESGNTIFGDVVTVGCTDTMIRSESRLVTAVGLDGCVVVETKDAVLVADKSHAQEVKTLVSELELAEREEVKLGREVFRPWGSYDSLENAEGFQVKRLTVLPGAILSLQLHHHRAEHWVVVAGIARITLDDKVFDLGVNEHTFIPVGAKHRIENPGDSILHIIEVQVGDYLGEDDIVRFEDKYGREGRTD